MHSSQDDLSQSSSRDYKKKKQKQIVASSPPDLQHLPKAMRGSLKLEASEGNAAQDSFDTFDEEVNQLQ